MGGVFRATNAIPEGKTLNAPIRIETLPENTRPGSRNGTTTPRGVKDDNPQGRRDAVSYTVGPGAGEVQIDVSAGDDSPVDADTILNRFERGARARLKPETIKRYRARFTAFALEINLNEVSMQALAGKRGNDIVLEFLNKHPQRSWRFLLGMLKTIWIFGVGKPFPVDVKTQIKKLPTVQRGKSPSDNIIRQWAEELNKHELDIQDKLVWLLIAEHGWRPSHVARLKWRNIQYKSDLKAGHDRPYSIEADGAQEGFKTSSPIAAKLCPDVVDTIERYASQVTNRLPDQPIIMSNGHPITQSNILRIFQALSKRYNLPKLRAKDLRHWVATTCRKVGLSKQSCAKLMGHDSSTGRWMMDWYDNPQDVDTLDEQGAKLPRGTLGTLDLMGGTATIEKNDGLPDAAVDLLKAYLDGKLNTFEFSNRMESIRMRLKDPKPQELLTP